MKTMTAKRHRHSLLLSTALIASGILVWQGKAVADELVDTAVTGPVTVYGNETLEVTSNGSVTSNETTQDAFGLVANGEFNTITNSGTIRATTFGGYVRASGIYAYDNNTITNSSTIEATATVSGNGAIASGINAGNDNKEITNSGMITGKATSSGSYAYAYGIYAGDDNIITNSGTITANATSESVVAYAYGIEVGNDNIITNSGTIKAIASGLSDVYASGIYANDGNAITNSGTIRAIASGVGDVYASGIEAGDDNTISNSGTIRADATATGSIANAFGIEVRDDNTITNSGTIEATATGSSAIAYGISARDGNTITNSGRILASADELANAHAIFFDGDSNTINLLAPSFLAGQLELGTGTDNAVNITTGPSHSVLWTFSGDMTGGAPTVDGPVAGFWNSTTQQFATIDPTNFAAADDWLADRASLIFNGLRARGRAMVPVGDTDDRSYDIWLSGLGSTSAYDSDGLTTMDYDIDQYGVMGGIDFEMSGDISLGLLAGYIDGQLQAGSSWEDSYSNSNEHDASGFFAGIRGGTDRGRVRIEAAFLAGMLDHDYARMVNDNLQSDGIGYAQASYGSFWISPEISISTGFEINEDLMLTPSVRARYAAQWIDGYTETGSSANAVVDDHNAAVGELVAEIAATRMFDFGSVTGRAGIMGRFGMGDEEVNVELIGDSNAVSTQNSDLVAGFVGLETSFYLSGNAALSVSGQAMMGEEMTRFQGAASIGVKF